MIARRKYLIQYAVFLIVVATALFLWNYFQPTERVHPLSWGIFGFFTIVFVAFHVFLLNAEDKKPGVLIRRFMAVSTIRLLGFLIVIVLYAMSNRELAVLFIWHFLIFYFLFVIFEIASLYNHFRPKS